MSDNFLSEAERKIQQRQQEINWWNANGPRVTQEFINTWLPHVVQVLHTIGQTWQARNPAIERQDGLMGFLFGSTVKEGNWYEIDVSEDSSRNQKSIPKTVYLYLWGGEAGKARHKRGGRHWSHQDRYDTWSLCVTINYQSFGMAGCDPSGDNQQYWQASSLEELKTTIASLWASNSISCAGHYYRDTSGYINPNSGVW